LKLSFTVSNQAYIFLYSILGGMIIAFIYDLLRIQRRALKTSNIIINIEDFIYWIIVAVVMFLMVYLSNEGEIRGYIFIGTVIGTILYIFLFSKIVIRFSLIIIHILHKTGSIIWNVLTFPFKVILKLLSFPLRIIIKVLLKILRKTKRAGKNKISGIIIRKKLIRNIIKKI
jgi:spore cortex biosynthesis protein YabQ